MISNLEFPFDLFEHDRMPGAIGEMLRSTRHLSMIPPFPWGQWLYGRVLGQQWHNLEGDIIELGVGQGGMSLFLGLQAKQLGKRVWSFDSFEGLPKPNPARDNPCFKERDYASRSNSPNLFERFKRAIGDFNLEETVFPCKGLFSETVPQLPAKQRFCFAHLDSDIYDSILISLELVYDRIVEGGLLIIDDYFHHGQGASRATSDFFNTRRIRPLYHVSFPYSVFVFKDSEKPGVKRSLDGNHYSFEWLKKDKYFMSILRLSLEKARRNGENARSFGNRQALLDLLRCKQSVSSDIYIYLRALESFWDSFADFTDENREPQLI